MIFLSNPQAAFFDTGVLIALFNKSEKDVADAVYEHLDKLPHASRHVVGPSMVELFYKLRKGKLVSPRDVLKNLDHLGITLFPVTPVQDADIFSSYCEISYKNEFDYADYYICRTALFFSKAEVLTIDRKDLPLALYKAQEHIKSTSCVQLVPFPQKTGK